MSLTLQQMAALQAKNEQEEEAVRNLGNAIGYGRTMQLAQQEWGKLARADGMGGSEFAYGPCVVMTEPCGCYSPSKCDWCCGSGWVTEKIRRMQLGMEG